MRLPVQRFYASAARVLNYSQNAGIIRNENHTHYLRQRLLVSSPTCRCLSTAAARAIALESNLDTTGRDVSSANPPDDIFSIPSNKETLKSINSQPLPVTCPGCGALSQETNLDEAGYYSRNRRAVKSFLKHQSTLQNKIDEDQKASTISPAEHASEQKSVGVENDATATSEASTLPQIEPIQTPVCDRCHDLIYYAKGQPIAHPSVENLADSIAESPFNRNHVYHVLDAADFPMSIIPGIIKRLELAKPRSQNRRSRHKFTTKPTMSFIVTRSDLLGPTKEMVDKMMPYFQGVLRSALGRTGQDMRLGNVHLVSAKRGWWTKDIKESIWERGGGNWMVGRVNVGKSNLFEVLFPKGSGERAPIYAELLTQEGKAEQDEKLNADFLSEDSLLPPAQPEVPFPIMPIVSNLPGTTASPIRLPFGNQRGELIDLPGIERGNLEDHVQPEHKLDLVMQHRPKVEQHIIKPGQSLLLGGGLIRITPRLDPNDRSTTMLAYPFVPVEAHVTATEKAVGTQLQERESGIKSILAEGSGSKMTSAGMLGLSTDVTKARAGPLLRAGIPVNKLPFRVYSTDILVEGVGWVELVCQVRRQWKPAPRSVTIDATEQQPIEEKPAQVDISAQEEPTFKPFFHHEGEPVVKTDTVVEAKVFQEFPIPQVEIFSPNGKHIGQRKPLGAWILWDEGRKQRARQATTGRPKKSMKGVKKQLKKQAREGRDNVN